MKRERQNQKIVIDVARAFFLPTELQYSYTYRYTEITDLRLTDTAVSEAAQ